MSFKYSIPTRIGTMKRTSVSRTYTHVVVVGPCTEGAIHNDFNNGLKWNRQQLAEYETTMASGAAEADDREFMQRLIGSYGKPAFDPNNAEHVAQVNDWVAKQKASRLSSIAQLKESIATSDARRAAALAKPYGQQLAGYCGRADLARKLADKFRGAHTFVDIVEITAEMVTETKKRSAA